MAVSSYIKTQFAKLAPSGFYRIRISGDQGGSTHDLNVSGEDLERIKKILLEAEEHESA